MVPIYKPIHEILQIAANDPGTKFVGERRIYNEFGHIGTFLDWSYKRGYVEKGRAYEKGTSLFTWQLDHTRKQAKDG